MNKLIAAIVAALLSSCGMFRESEISPRTVTLDPSAKNCALSPLSEITNPKTVTAPLLRTNLDCLEVKLEDAFRSIKGEFAGEITVRELRLLQQKGVFTAPLHHEDHWVALEAISASLHPEGRPALQRRHLKQILAWLRGHQELYLAVLKAAEDSGTFSAELTQKTATAVGSAVELLSDASTLSESQALAIARTLLTPKPIHPEKVDRAVRVGWILKDLVLSKNVRLAQTDHGQRPLEIGAFKRLLRLAVSATQAAPEAIRWGIAGGTNEVPTALPKESTALLELISDYLNENRFREVELDEVEWALRSIGADTAVEMVPDLLIIGRRLVSDPSLSGFHPKMILPLAREFPRFVEELLASASAFSLDAPSGSLQARTRSILNHPVLSKIALKGKFRRALDPNEQLPKRLDLPLQWDEAMSRLLQRRMILRLFTAFDRDGDGKILLNASNSQDAREALDLAYTFLRLLTPPSKDKDDERLPEPVMIRPSALYKTMGLIGDAWMPDGNNDDALNSDELFSVVSVYGEIQKTTQFAAYNLGGIQPYVLIPGQLPWDLKGGPYYRRSEFVQAAPSGILREIPHLKFALDALGAPSTNSLMHALVGVPDAPVEAYATHSNTPVTLVQWARQDSMLAPAAVLTLINRLMIRCDRDEDEQLSWSELDCAVPLLVRASYETVSSELVELDPIVHDGSALALQFLQQPGTPLAIGKILAINGSIRELRLDPKKLDELTRREKVTWLQIARFLGAREGVDPNIWILEAQKRYQTCDTDQSDFLEDKEMNCFAQLTLERLLQLGGGHDPQALFQAVGGKDLLLTAIKLAATEGVKDRLKTDPGRLLGLMESVIRRGKPLCTLPGC